MSHEPKGVSRNVDSVFPRSVSNRSACSRSGGAAAAAFAAEYSAQDPAATQQTPQSGDDELSDLLLQIRSVGRQLYALRNALLSVKHDMSLAATQHASPDARHPAPDTPASVIVGTAGHIDHGKSALVRALTGSDPDRLPEEKRRGSSTSALLILI